jgi:hypothetical protein
MNNVVNGNGPVDAIDRLATSSARFGVVGVMTDLQIEDTPASAPAHAPSKAAG